MDKRFCVVFIPTAFVHNRVLSRQLHYWGSGSLMGYPLEKLFGRCFFNNGLIRHLIIWEALRFQGFNMDMVFSSKWTSFTQRKVYKGGESSSWKKTWIWEKTFHNRAPPPPSTRYLRILENKSTIEVHHTNQYTTLMEFINQFITGGPHCSN